MRAMQVAVLLLFSASLAGCMDSLQDNRAPTALFTMTVDGGVIDDGRAIVVGQRLALDASASSDDDGDTLTWDWTISRNMEVIFEMAGKTAEWKADNAGSVTILLTVRDGAATTTKEATVNVVQQGAVAPKACAGGNEGTCPDPDSTSSPNTYYAYTITVDKESNDREMSETMDVELDASGSSLSSDADLNARIDEYIWDLDTTIDADGDGDDANDRDAEGVTHKMTGLSAGVYPIALTVVDNNGLDDRHETMVYIDWIGQWSEMTVGRNDSQSDNDVDFVFTATYDSSPTTKNIRRVEIIAIYPEQDEDLNNPIGGQFSDNELDLYIYNSTDDEVQNNSGDEDRENANCEMEENEECTRILISRSFFRVYDDGDWTALLFNGQRHDTGDVRITIHVQYGT
ncbi:MAG TPA: hypothetical protein QF646_02805 [Candidatus Poseidoniales archaeon]|nr:hypothetical protein [Candidatus Poseidoniales archaeon]